MANYKSKAEYASAKQQEQTLSEAITKLPKARAEVTRLRTRHSELCKEFGDSGSVRQALHEAEDWLSEIESILRAAGLNPKNYY